MSKSIKTSIQVKDQPITILTKEGGDYLSLTDMLRAKEGDFFLSSWLRNRNTIEFLGIWESIHNPSFNCVEFDTIASSAGLNSYRIGAKEWCERTNAIGLFATTGRYGGTYAHADIAFEFGMWISPEFKLHLIKEFRRLKDDEAKRQSQSWDLHRTLSKINYRIHTDAIKACLVPVEITSTQAAATCASEADLLNVSLFGLTAAEWRAANPEAAGNMRDHATLEQLLVLANLESLNAEFIHLGHGQEERLTKLNQAAIRQMTALSVRQGPKQGTLGAMLGIEDKGKEERP